jgi:uncharacterized repeat protein (TIGR01451 family)
MAGETILSLVSQYIPDIMEAALMYARHNTFMPSIVESFTDQDGWQAREVTEYVEGTVDDNLGELEDLTPQEFNRALRARLTVKEIGKQILLSRRRLRTDPESVMSDAATSVGYEMSKKVESDLLGVFSSFTAGLVDKNNAALTWQDLYNGRSELERNSIPGPYNAVLHTLQWLDLATAANIAAVGTSTTSQPVLRIRDEIQSQYYVGSVNDMNIFVSGLVPVDGNADALGGIFSRDAVAFDLRQGLLLEPDADPSLRAVELNWTMVYAHGVWQPTHGVKILSDATSAVSAVSTASNLTALGVLDDNTASVGQDVMFIVVVTNIQPSTITTGIQLTVTVPAGATYISDSVSQGSYVSASGVWAVGALAPGQSATGRFTYDVTVTGNFRGLVTAQTPTDASPGDTGNIAVTVS